LAVRAYIGIGSNLGRSHDNCLEAVDRLSAVPATRLAAVSPWYASRPVGVVGQGWFVNGAAGLETGLPARELLRHLLRIEAEMGRVRKMRWEARIIDLDLLLYGSRRICDNDLTVPHPRMHERRFVLVPLVDLDPDLVHPDLGVPVGSLLAGLDAEGQELFPLKAGSACAS
jgi:2-amino-4-hydroxy-6-hydroxymethyldihydropteridine diphosphokinase